MRGVASPRLAEDFRAAGLGNFTRAVSHVGVGNDDDFAGPARDAVERAADAMRLVAGNQTDGNRQKLHVLKSRFRLQFLEERRRSLEIVASFIREQIGGIPCMRQAKNGFGGAAPAELRLAGPRRGLANRRQPKIPFRTRACCGHNLNPSRVDEKSWPGRHARSCGTAG